jgi:hypothetical protein
VQGDALGTLELGAVPRLKLAATLPSGTLNLELHKNTTWQGKADLNITAPQGGTLGGRVALEGDQLNGTLEGKGVKLNVGGSPLEFSGNLGLTGQDFKLTGQLTAQGGRLRLSGDGAVADLIPGISGLGFNASDNGYAFQAKLDSVSLRDLKGLPLPPYLEGKVSGSANITQGVSSFNLRTDKLTLAGEELPARLEGTFSEGNWRLRGGVGDSTLVGNITDGLLNVRFDLQQAPLHALVGAYSGPLPGRASATGIARYRGRLDDLLGGQAQAVAERLTLSSSDGKTLKGTGQLEYQNGIVRIPSIDLGGAGRWHIEGEYSPEKADLKANFTDTTFTPVLALIPALKDLKPSLRGSLNMQVGGTFDAPQITLEGKNIQGQLSGLDFSVPRISGGLQQNIVQLSAQVQPKGVLEGNTTLELGGKIQNGALEELLATLKGNLNIQNFGPLEQIDATLRQDGTRYLLSSSALQGGKLTVDGELFPALELKVEGQNITPVMPSLYAKESKLNVKGTFSKAGSRYVVGGNVDIIDYLLGSVSTPDDGKDKTTDKTTGKTFISPLPESQTTFPRAQTEVAASKATILDLLDFQNVTLNARGGLFLDEILARGEFGGNLILSGSGTNPQLAGKLSPLRGKVFLRENAFDLDTSKTEILFNPADGAYPKIHLAAKGNVPYKGQPLEVLVDLTGIFVDALDGKTGILEKKLQLETVLGLNPAQRSQYPELFSGGTVDQAKLYTLVVLGTDNLNGDNLSNVSVGLGQSAVKTALNVFFLGELERGIAKTLGLSEFKINTNLLDLKANSNVNVDFTVGTYLTRDFYLQYNVDLTGKGLVNAVYNTPDGRLSFRVSTPLQGLDLWSARPSYSVNLNLDTHSSLQIGVESVVGNSQNTKFSVGYQFKL